MNKQIKVEKQLMHLIRVEKKLHLRILNEQMSQIKRINQQDRRVFKEHKLSLNHWKLKSVL